MKIKSRLLIFSFFFLSLVSEAQPYVFNSSAFKEFKDGKLYVVMSKENGENNDYMDVFKEVWTYCPVEIIEKEDIFDFMKKGSFFMYLTVNCIGDNLEYKKLTKYSITFQLTLFTPKPEFLKTLEKNPTANKNLNLNEIGSFVGRIKLKPDDSKRFNINEAFKTDYMGKSYIISSGPGILKNYLQFFQKAMEEKIFWQEMDDYCNVKEIKKLKSYTLYVPEELLKGYASKEDKVKEKDSENEYDMDEIAKKAEYPGKYQVVSLDKLNKLIMSSEDLFFYVSLYSGIFGHAALNIMTVTNAQTGDIIYKGSTSTVNSFSPNLIKDLSKLIQKANK